MKSYEEFWKETESARMQFTEQMIEKVRAEKDSTNNVQLLLVSTIVETMQYTKFMMKAYHEWLSAQFPE